MAETCPYPRSDEIPRLLRGRGNNVIMWSVNKMCSVNTIYMYPFHYYDCAINEIGSSVWLSTFSPCVSFSLVFHSNSVHLSLFLSYHVKNDCPLSLPSTNSMAWAILYLFFIYSSTMIFLVFFPSILFLSLSFIFIFISNRTIKKLWQEINQRNQCKFVLIHFAND